MRLWRALIGTYGAGWAALAVALPLVLGTALAGLGYYFWPEDTLEVPRLVGYTQSGAEKRTGDDFEIDVAERTDSNEPEGYVLSQDPEPGERARPGSTVSIVVSTGQETAEVPDVEGKAQEEAEDALRSEGFEVKVEAKESSAEYVGKVIGQSPTAGGEEEGSTVRITVGEAPSTVTVPDVAGDTEEEATNALRSEGFEAKVETEESSEGEAGEVLAQDPSGGTEAEHGSGVTITVGEGPPPAPTVASSGGEQASEASPDPAEQNLPAAPEGGQDGGEPAGSEDTVAGPEDSPPAASPDPGGQYGPGVNSTPSDGGMTVGSGGTSVVTDDTGALSVEVPAEWSDVNGSAGESAGEAGLEASTDLASYAAGNEPGVTMFASQQYIQLYTPEALLDYYYSLSGGCEYHTDRLPYDDGTFVGTYDKYTGCGGGGFDIFVIAAAPTSQAYMALVFIRTPPTEAGTAVSDRIAQTFVVDESRLPAG